MFLTLETLEVAHVPALTLRLRTLVSKYYLQILNITLTLLIFRHSLLLSANLNMLI